MAAVNCKEGLCPVVFIVQTFPVWGSNVLSNTQTDHRQGGIITMITLEYLAGSFITKGQQYIATRYTIQNIVDIHRLMKVLAPAVISEVRNTRPPTET